MTVTWLKSLSQALIYLLSCKNLELKPNHCIVFEDSLSGVKAAKDGGFKVIAVGNKELLEKADFYIDNFLDFKLDQYATVS